MKLSLSQVRNYLNRLGISIIAGEPFDLGKIMPLNIARRYDAFRANIINDECIIMLPHNDDTSPDDIALHNTTLRNALLLRPIFAFPRLDREFASSLKSAKIAYIVWSDTSKLYIYGWPAISVKRMLNNATSPLVFSRPKVSKCEDINALRRCALMTSK